MFKVGTSAKYQGENYYLINTIWGGSTGKHYGLDFGNSVFRCVLEMLNLAIGWFYVLSYLDGSIVYLVFSYIKKYVVLCTYSLNDFTVL